MATEDKATKFMNRENELDDVGSAVVRKVLGISGATLAKYKQIFTPLPGPRGRYNLPIAVQNYLAFVKGDDRAGSVQAGRGRLYEQQTAKLELQNRVANGELVPIEHARGVVSAFSSALRAGLVALPGRIANQAAGMSKPGEVRALINGEVEELLRAIEGVASELSPDPEATAGNGTGVVDPKADPKPKPGPMGRRKQSATNRKRGAGKVAK